MSEKRRFLIHHPKDNVAVILEESLKKGEEIIVGSRKIKLRSKIPFGHKVAIRQIPQGDFAVKYGEKIGRAKKDIQAGDHVHVSNLEDVVDELRAMTLEAIGISRASMREDIS
jgi:altronate dehydratase